MLKSFRGDTIVYTLYGPSRIDNLKKDDMVLDNNGKYVKILNIDKKFIKSSIYKVKLHDSFDNSYLTKKCKVLAIQDVPYDLKNNEVKKYIEEETRNSRPTFITINNLTDFDYIGYPIPSFTEENYGETPDYYRFYGLVTSSGFSNNFLLNINKNANTLNFIKSFLTSRNIQFDEKKINSNVLLSYESNILNITKFNFKYNNLNKECSIELFKGLIELYIKDNNAKKSYIYYKTNLKYYVHILKFLFMKFGYLISVFFYKDDADSNISYYVIKLPYNSFIKNLFNSSEFTESSENSEELNVDKNIAIHNDTDNDKNNYFIYNNIIWSKVKSINIIPYSGYVYSLSTENNMFLTEIGVINNIDNL